LAEKLRPDQRPSQECSFIHALQDSRYFSSLSDLYTELNEEDVLCGLWKRRCQTLESRNALGWLQHGYLDQAQDTFLLAMSKHANKTYEAGQCSLLPLRLHSNDKQVMNLVYRLTWNVGVENERVLITLQLVFVPPGMSCPRHTSKIFFAPLLSLCICIRSSERQSLGPTESNSLAQTASVGYPEWKAFAPAHQNIHGSIHPDHNAT